MTNCLANIMLETPVEYDSGYFPSSDSCPADANLSKCLMAQGPAESITELSERTSLSRYHNGASSTQNLSTFKKLHPTSESRKQKCMITSCFSNSSPQRTTRNEEPNLFLATNSFNNGQIEDDSKTRNIKRHNQIRLKKKARINCCKDIISNFCICIRHRCSSDHCSSDGEAKYNLPNDDSEYDTLCDILERDVSLYKDYSLPVTSIAELDNMSIVTDAAK